MLILEIIEIMAIIRGLITGMVFLNLMMMMTMVNLLGEINVKIVLLP
jgi:hypothetical protein